MSITSIIAFLSVLAAFNVPQPTINQIRDILIPPQIVTVGTTTQAVPAHITPVPVQQSPIIPNQPVQFGSVPPPPPPCDDTPVTTVTAHTLKTSEFKEQNLQMPITVASSTIYQDGQPWSTDWPVVLFDVKTQSQCPTSNWLMDEYYPTADGQTYHALKDSPNGKGQFQPFQLGTSTVTFVVHDGTNTATTTVDIVAK